MENIIISKLIAYENMNIYAEAIVNTELAREIYNSIKDIRVVYSEYEGYIDEVLNNNSIIAITNGIDGEWYFQSIFTKDGEILSDDVIQKIIIEDELVDCVNLDAYEELNEVIVVNEKNKNEYLDEVVNDILDIIRISKRDNICLDCSLREYVETLL